MNKERNTQNLNQSGMPEINRRENNGVGGGMQTQNGWGRVANNTESRELSELREKIRELGFVKVELELYLDTHPTCKVALDYYYKTVDALASLMEEYHAKGGNPLVASGSVDTESWSWVNMPWPWHNTDNMTGNSGR